MGFSRRWTGDRGDRAPTLAMLLRLLRYLGFGRNELRRTSDRIEGYLAGLLLLVGLLAVPIAGYVGTDVYSTRTAAATAQAATERHVTAVLQQDAPAQTTVPDQSADVVRPQVPVRWVDSGHHEHTGLLEVEWDSRAGSTVPIWIAPDGSLAAAPPKHGLVLVSAVIAAIGFLLGSIAVAMVVGQSARQLLTRHREKALDREWQRTEPRWTSH